MAHTTHRPISARLANAIGRLFADPSPAFGCLALDVELEAVSPFKEAVKPIDRVRTVQDALENYVVAMANESEELGCPVSTESLRGQAIGLLIALRELQRHFPEV